MLFWYCLNIVYIAMLTMSRKKYALDMNDNLLLKYLHLQICSLLWTYRVNKTYNSVWTFLCRHNDRSKVNIEYCWRSVGCLLLPQLSLAAFIFPCQQRHFLFVRCSRDTQCFCYTHFCLTNIVTLSQDCWVCLWLLMILCIYSHEL